MRLGLARGWWVLVVLAGACGDDGEGTEVLPAPTYVEGECGRVDVACPAARPHPGAACRGDLRCTYPEPPATWVLTCVDGGWTASATCDEEVRGACFLPSGAETCEAPFAGTAEGTVEIGVGATTGGFRALEEGELVDVEVGGQGSSMIWYRVRVAGKDPPSCVRVTTIVDGTVVDFPQEIVRDVVLRCGDSLDMFTIVPYGDCTPAGQPVSLTLTVDLQGIGQSERTIRVPDDAVCGASG